MRRTLGLAFDGETDPIDFVLADILIAGMPLPADEVGIFWHSTGMALFVPIAPGRSRIIADLRPSSLRELLDPVLWRSPALCKRRDDHLGVAKRMVMTNV